MGVLNIIRKSVNGKIKEEDKNFDTSLTEEKLDEMFEKAGIECGLIFVVDGQYGATSMNNISINDLRNLRETIDDAIESIGSEEQECICGRCGEDEGIDTEKEEFLKSLLRRMNPKSVEKIKEIINNY